MSKTITLRVDDKHYQLFNQTAEAENRSLANLIETYAARKILEEQFIDNYEMDEILQNKNLVKRLKEGSEEAKKMKGNFVD